MPEMVTVIIRPNLLYCTWFDHTKKDIFPLKIRAQANYSSDMVYCSQNSLLNATYFMQCIQDFLARNSLKNPYVLLSFSADALYEKYILVERESVGMSHMQSEHRSLVWNYCVLEPAHEKSLVYVYGLSRAQIVQYQLAALRTPFNCIFITSIQRALLQLLWSVRKSKSSSEVIVDSKLDFTHCLPSLLKYAEHTYLNNHSFNTNEMENVCAAMGLYILGYTYESV